MLPDALKETIRQLWPQAVALSDDLHAHPELGHEEFHASQTMVDLLRKACLLYTSPSPRDLG